MEDISDTEQNISLNERPSQIRKFDNGRETISSQRKQKATSSGTIRPRHQRNARQRGKGYRWTFHQHRHVLRGVKKNNKNLQQSKSKSDTDSDSDNLCSIKTHTSSQNDHDFVNSMPFKKEVKEKTNDYEFLHNSVNTNQTSFSNIETYENDKIYNDSSSQGNNNPDFLVSKLFEARKAQEVYVSLVQSFDPAELIMTYRKEVDDMSNYRLSKNVKKIQGFSKMISENHEYSPILKLHNENLLLQQTQFDTFVTSVRTKFSFLQFNNNEDILREADDIKLTFESECSLFEKTYPAYGYKSRILSALNKNQMIIVSADLSYFFNVVTPVIIYSELKTHYIMYCESNNMASEYVKDKFINIIKKTHNYSNINFTTEDKMLNDMKDKDVKKFVAIINLPLKRSINADFLLARLRDLLLQQEDSKLILLTSVFDSKRKYLNYFSQLKIFELEVPKLLLPVKTMWKKEPSQNYRDDIVCTALSILILHKTGNILAFVPNEDEALKIVAMFNNKLQVLKNIKVECILLNGNNSISHFSNQPNSNRRIVYFASNCYEILPIPSVQHLIDCGLKRDYIFAKEKNLDVLSTVFCSRAAARLRKSLVGIYKDGLCYRIYNKENFCKNMQSFESPELHTRNPFNTLIKLFQYAPENALYVEFIEPLHDAVMSNNVKLLRNFNAVKEGKLTELGKKIVKLPLPARYSKLLLQGIDWGYGYEAAILVAYFSVDQFVFKYSKDEEFQRVIDGAKLDLIQYESDALSFLYIFKTWKQNNCNNSWCDKFHIKCDTLHVVEAKMLEVCQIALNCAGEDIFQEFSESNDLPADLTRILLDSFGDQFCVFSGHYRSGYRILSSSETAFLHPSSMLCNKENLPQFIIFNKMICTTRNFLVGITALPPDLVLNSLTDTCDKILQYDHFDIFERTLEKKTIEPVGERIIKQILLGKRGKKLQEIEDYIKTELRTDSLVIEPSAEKGCVHVYAMESVLSSAVKMVDEILKSNVEDVINAQQVHILTLKKGEKSIPLEVKCIMGAKIISVKALESKFLDSQQNNSQMAQVYNKETCSPLKHCINLTWIRRQCSGICFIDFTRDGFSIVRKLAGKNISILDSEVEVILSKKADYQLRLVCVPEDARTNDIENALEKYVPLIEVIKIEMKFIPPFETTAKDVADIKIEIQDICEEFTDLCDFEIVVPKPKNTSTIFTAYINVFCTEDLTETAECLSNIYLENFKLDAKPVYRSIISTSKKVFTALESRLKEELTELKNELAKIHPNMKDIFSFHADEIGEKDLVLLKLLSNNIQIMKQLQRTVNELLEGEVLNKAIVNDIHKLFCHGGHMWLRQLEKSKRVFILDEYSSKIIRVYGSQERCFQVKKCIINFLEDTENEAVESMSLSNDKQNRILLKSIIKEYGVNLEIFIEQCGLRSAMLDIKSNKLLLHGSRESIDRAKSALDQLSDCLESTVECALLSGGEMCPVCATPAFNLTFRLQHCNHLYCRECLLGLVTQANFPIQCCAKNCSEDIVLDDIANILDEDDAKIKKLLHASLNDFLEQNRTDIVYCPIPDCSMFFYREDIIGNRQQCPLCLNEVCFKCNVAYHYGYDCDVFQGSRKDPDYSFKVWKKTTSECKECPRCHTAIERFAGCDYMACTSCKAHFCWVCLREFRSSTEVYNHIPFCDKYPKW